MLKVLITDDDENVYECLSKIIDWGKLQCAFPDVAYNGVEAWEKLSHEKYDLLICDIKMPIMDGSKLCQLIYENNIQITIVILSAYEDFSVARAALKYGVIDYILKPINKETIENLEKIINDVVENKYLVESDLLKRNFKELIFDAFEQDNYKYIEKILNDMYQLSERNLNSVGIELLRGLCDYLISTTGQKGYEAFYRESLQNFLCFESSEKIEFIKKVFIKQKNSKLLGGDLRNKQLANKVCDIVEENYSNPDCSLEWISRNVGMSSGYVSKVFKRVMGISVVGFIADFRIQRACYLLQNKNYRINEIAVEVGYIDPNYFMRTFRNKMGMSPTEYRNKSEEMVNSNV